jgi:Lysozyme like domain
MTLWSDETMKAISKVRVMLGTISVSAVVLGTMIGLSAPAVAPSKAEAQMLVLKKYQNYAKFQPKELVTMLQAVGFKGESLKYAWAIAMKESHGNALSYNGNTHTGDHSYGLFQINMLGSMGADRRAYYGLAYNAQLLNPVTNAQIAYQMSNAGRNWSAWKGTRQKVVQDWLAMYPYKAHTQEHKAKAKPKQKH